MEKKKVSVEVVLKYDHTKTSRIMEITTDEDGIKNLAKWMSLVAWDARVESKPMATGYFTCDFKTQTTTWSDVHGKPINEPEPMDAEVKLVKTGFYVNQKQVDDLKALLGNRMLNSAYLASTVVWRLEKRQYTPGSMTLKQVYDLIYKYIGL